MNDDLEQGRLRDRRRHVRGYWDQPDISCVVQPPTIGDPIRR